jgi:hypothetical protein
MALIVLLRRVVILYDLRPYRISLHFEVLQLLSCLFSFSSDGCDLWLRCLINLSLCLLGSGILREVLGEGDKFRGSGKVLSEWLGYIEALFNR